MSRSCRLSSQPQAVLTVPGNIHGRLKQQDETRLTRYCRTRNWRALPASTTRHRRNRLNDGIVGVPRGTARVRSITKQSDRLHPIPARG